MKKQFLEEMKEKENKADKKSDVEVNDNQTEQQPVHPTLKDLLDEQEKFPNFPPHSSNEVTNRTPRDYSTLTRVSSVTTPSYPNPSSVSTSSYSGGGIIIITLCGPLQFFRLKCKFDSCSG